MIQAVSASSGIGVINNKPAADIAVGTPTVPAKGSFIGNISDYLASAVDIWAKYDTVKTQNKIATTQAQQTVTLKEVPLGTSAPSGAAVAPVVIPANATQVGSAPGQVQQAGFNLSPVLIIGALAVIGLVVFLMRRK